MSSLPLIRAPAQFRRRRSIPGQVPFPPKDGEVWPVPASRLSRSKPAGRPSVNHDKRKPDGHNRAVLGFGGKAHPQGGDLALADPANGS